VKILLVKANYDDVVWGSRPGSRQDELAGSTSRINSVNRKSVNIWSIS
jgi:hypothetical protein